MGRGDRQVNAPAAASRYSFRVGIAHWLLAVLILTLFVMGWYMVEIPKKTPPVAFWYNLHKSVGLVAALPILYLLWWRATHRAPLRPATMPAWEVRGARLNHLLFYLCLVVMTLSGFVESNFTKWGITFFGTTLPPLFSPDKQLSDLFNAIHVYTSYLFIGLIAIHIAAALKHLAIDRDGVTERMWPWS